MDLERCWVAFWRAAGAHGDPAGAWRELARRYSEPHRAYHVLAHVADCMDEWDAVRPLAEDPIAVELALWYHDAAYDTHASDNEERSAALAVDAARAMGLPAATCERAAGLVLATRHATVPPGGDEALVVDVDLAILGRPRGRFDEYEQEIRREYAWVPDAIFDEKRREILRGFLDRPRIYSTAYFFDRFEQAARENLRRSLGVAPA